MDQAILGSLEILTDSEIGDCTLIAEETNMGASTFSPQHRHTDESRLAISITFVSTRLLCHLHCNGSISMTTLNCLKRLVVHINQRSLSVSSTVSDHQ
jgi:hypothetical protein